MNFPGVVNSFGFGYVDPAGLNACSSGDVLKKITALHACFARRPNPVTIRQSHETFSLILAEKPRCFITEGRCNIVVKNTFKGFFFHDIKAVERDLAQYVTKIGCLFQGFYPEAHFAHDVLYISSR